MDDDSHGSGATDDTSERDVDRRLVRPRAGDASNRCPHHSPLCRHSSNQSAQSAQSCQSASTINTLGGSSSKDNNSRYDDVFGDGAQSPPSPMDVPIATSATGFRSGAHHHHHHHHGYMPGLHRRHEGRALASTILQHYYPEGGWGWVVTACVFMVHVLTTGMQLSYGILYVEILRHFGPEYVIQAGWLGVLSFAVSLFLAPFVVALCRRKSTRLTAVFGGLVMALACLFTSFAQQMHQVFLSYGIVMGIGVGLTRETSNLMIGQYFKRRREFIEIIIQSGSGIGIALFSVFLKECISSIGWRLGLQAVTGALFLCFLLGIFYRSASLYHPQRRAILHLKSQKRKVKDKSKLDDKPPYFDFTTLRTKTMQIIMLATGTSALGLYSPIFFLMLQGTQEGLEGSSLILLQTFIGFAFAVGCVGFGLVVVRQSEQCMIARQYLCQAALFGLGFSILALSAVQGYHGYVLFVWIYGIFLGGYHYSVKMFTLEKVRARFFSRAWGFVQWAQSLPVLFGVPISGYINSGQGTKSGYYFSCTCTLVGAGTLFLLNFYKRSVHKRDTTVSFASIESRGSTSGTFEPILAPRHHHPNDGVGGVGGGGSGGSGGGHIATVDGELCQYHDGDPEDDEDEDDREAEAAGHHHHHQHQPMSRFAKSISFATSVDVIDDKRPDYLTCISEEGLVDNLAFDDFYAGECITSCNKVENYLMYSEYENNLLEANSVEETNKKARAPTPPPPPPSCTSGSDSEDMASLTSKSMLNHQQQQRGPQPRRCITVIEEMTTSV